MSKLFANFRNKKLLQHFPTAIQQTDINVGSNRILKIIDIYIRIYFISVIISHVKYLLLHTAYS